MERDNVTRFNKTFWLNSIKEPFEDIPLPVMSEWALMLKDGAREQLLLTIKSFMENVRGHGDGVNASWIQNFYQDFLQMVFYVLQMNGLPSHQVFAKNVLTERPDEVLRSIDALEEWAIYILEVAFGRLHHFEKNQTLIDKIKRLMLQKIGDPNFSREDIANQVFLSPDYLTRIFKKETGMSLAEYFQQQRIENAKRLLTTTTMSVSKIAFESGYFNLSYFSTVFKKMTQCNPLEYRKQNR